MEKKTDNLVWLDMEMTGLDPNKDRIIEVATIITNSQLETLAESPIIVIHQPNELLDTMDAWNTHTHSKTGLIGRVQKSIITEQGAEEILLEFVKKWVNKNQSPLCGNSVHQDRRFMSKYMPELESYFHYRNIDVSTVKELAKRWKPEIVKGFNKKGAHQALEDIIESIEEMKYYRKHFFSL